jgi:hypothetical protein
MAGKKKGSSKNQTATARAEESKLAANAPLKCAKDCCDCGTKLTKRGEVEAVKVVGTTGKARMKSRCKGGCKRQ